MLASLLFGGGKQEQKQEVEQIAAPQEQIQETDPIFITPQETITYAPQYTHTTSSSYQYAPVTTEITGRDIWAYLSPYASMIPTQTVTPYQQLDISPQIAQAVAPLQAQLQELLSGQTQEAKQEGGTNWILILLAAAAGYFLLKDRRA